jgi:hypothetical protein
LWVVEDASSLKEVICFFIQIIIMNYQNEYQQELQKDQDRDFSYSRVSSSFLFYLQVACIVAMFWGMLYAV